ncbi:MAG: hypothetical protein QOF89_1553 [Acidobacteriota bacterium]|jgi:hypothetical protein|nr:hypothetical protein [Acidobacteriota bacterium]
MPAYEDSAPSLHLPSRGVFPRVDDHLVEPEITRDEIIGGRRVVAFPAHPPHALRHTRLDYVIEANVVPGYSAATDLLTRHDLDSDFASDTCVVKDGVDPETGARYLEEIAFEVVSEQDVRDVSEKALRMHRRGVRRVFAIFVKGGKVCEWCPETQGWRALPPSSQLEDPCLVAPLPVPALLDAAAADAAVARALIAKDNPEIRQEKAAAEAQGRARGLAEGAAGARALDVVAILETRGLIVTEAQRQRILSCTDLDQLSLWLRRAVLAASADEITAEP